MWSFEEANWAAKIKTEAIDWTRNLFHGGRLDVDTIIPATPSEDLNAYHCGTASWIMFDKTTFIFYVMSITAFVVSGREGRGRLYVFLRYIKLAWFITASNLHAGSSGDMQSAPPTFFFMKYSPGQYTLLLYPSLPITSTIHLRTHRILLTWTAYSFFITDTPRNGILWPYHACWHGLVWEKHHLHSLNPRHCISFKPKSNICR